MAKPSRAGLTIPELLVTMCLFTLLFVLTFVLFAKGTAAVRRANSRHQVQLSLNKAHFWLERDLNQAAAGSIKTKRVPLPGNGDAVWFLSAEDPTEYDPDLQFKNRAETGTPLYQTNILYYLVRPGDYQKVSGGLSAAIDPDPSNDFYAAHKFLIRKVIDTPTDPEELMDEADIDAYITTPTDYTLSPFQGEANVVNYRLIADKLLSFEVTLSGSTAQVGMSAVKLEEARRSVPLGQISLRENQLTERREAVYELRN